MNPFFKESNVILSKKSILQNLFKVLFVIIAAVFHAFKLAHLLVASCILLTDVSVFLKPAPCGRLKDALPAAALLSFLMLPVNRRHIS